MSSEFVPSATLYNLGNLQPELASSSEGEEEEPGVANDDEHEAVSLQEDEAPEDQHEETEEQHEPTSPPSPKHKAKRPKKGKA